MSLTFGFFLPLKRRARGENAEEKEKNSANLCALCASKRPSVRFAGLRLHARCPLRGASSAVRGFASLRLHSPIRFFCFLRLKPTKESLSHERELNWTKNKSLCSSRFKKLVPLDHSPNGKMPLGYHQFPTKSRGNIKAYQMLPLDCQIQRWCGVDLAPPLTPPDKGGEPYTPSIRAVLFFGKT